MRQKERDKRDTKKDREKERETKIQKERDTKTEKKRKGRNIVFKYFPNIVPKEMLSLSVPSIT